MLAWAKARFFPARANPDALFQPPSEVVARRDTIDDELAADRERLPPGKRLLLMGATAAVSAGGIGGNNLIEVRQVWGQQDVYSQARPGTKSVSGE